MAAKAAPSVIAGENEVCGAASPRNWQPTQDHGKQEDEHRFQGEIGNRKSQQSENAHGVVGGAAGTMSGENAGGDRDGDADERSATDDNYKSGRIAERTMRATGC